MAGTPAGFRRRWSAAREHCSAWCCRSGVWLRPCTCRACRGLLPPALLARMASAGSLMSGFCGSGSAGLTGAVGCCTEGSGATRIAGATLTGERDSADLLGVSVGRSMRLGRQQAGACSRRPPGRCNLRGGTRSVRQRDGAIATATASSHRGGGHDHLGRHRNGGSLAQGPYCRPRQRP